MAGDILEVIRRQQQYCSFNPRPRMAGDLRLCKLSIEFARSFNPRPRMAGDLELDELGTLEEEVSIRARAWRAI